MIRLMQNMPFTEKNHLELPIWKASSEAVKRLNIEKGLQS
jgi:hypothetical protein